MKDKGITIINEFLNLILPRRCPLCSSNLRAAEGPLCRDCYDSIREINGPCCPTCGCPLPSSELLEINPAYQCGDCRIDPPSLDSARSLLYFDGPVRDGIHLFKYSGYWKLGKELIRSFRPAIEELRFETDRVLPIPLDAARLRRRGFNQAVVLAREVSEILAIPFALNLLHRTRKVSPQVGLSRKERIRNVQGSIAIMSLESVEGLNLLLVDDVITTGTTANESARVLKEGGASSVHLLTLAGTYFGDEGCQAGLPGT